MLWKAVKSYAEVKSAKFNASLSLMTFAILVDDIIDDDDNDEAKLHKKKKTKLTNVSLTHKRIIIIIITDDNCNEARERKQIKSSDEPATALLSIGGHSHHYHR